MCADRLQELVRQADADAEGAPPMPADLATRVWRRARGPRWHLRGLSAAAALLLIVVGTWALWPVGDLKPTPDAAVPAVVAVPAASQRRLEQLHLEAEWRRALALEIIEERAAQDRLASLQAQADVPDPRGQIRRSLEQAAEVLVAQGDRLRLEGQRPEDAVEAYRLAADLFPRSTWAAVARARLDALVR